MLYIQEQERIEQIFANQVPNFWWSIKYW